MAEDDGVGSEDESSEESGEGEQVYADDDDNYQSSY